MRWKEGPRPITYLKGNAAELLEQMRRVIGLLKLVAQGDSDVQAGRWMGVEISRTSCWTA